MKVIGKLGVFVFLLSLTSVAYMLFGVDVITHVVPPIDVNTNDTRYVAMQSVRNQSSRVASATNQLTDVVRQAGSPNTLTTAVFGIPGAVLNFLGTLIGLFTDIITLLTKTIGGAFGIPSEIVGLVISILSFVIVYSIFTRLTGGEV